ncbi:hypothetical protein [Methylobacterium nodulans]|uniref:Uncharacterized protein n=1 Tax=Methylobacterium nodulans (strain LMG 21967 / CNCM I-2342 / ORS 2060) TaxID=460265 RepID=B8IET7_METNO|nr:hypothetical protein [Methylobacterium nodulans]ACL61430.1 hypothetical protein Mnod_6666 [Methylobacterium nodulans ORS 2060]
MRLREKDSKNGEVATKGWDEAQAALLAGTHVSAEDEGGEGERGPDQPAAQSPKPGSEPSGGDDLDGKTRPELEAFAVERGVDVSGAETRADVIAALRARP